MENETLQIILHIGGASGVAYVILSLFTTARVFYACGPCRERQVANMAAWIGCPVDEALEEPRYSRHHYEYALMRFNPERWENRLSDFVATVMTLIGWLATFLFLAGSAGLGWLIWDGAEPFIAWALPIATLVYELAKTVINQACKVLTGRLPGEARTIQILMKNIVNREGWKNGLLPGQEDLSQQYPEGYFVRELYEIGGKA